MQSLNQYIPIITMDVNLINQLSILSSTLNKFGQIIMFCCYQFKSSQLYYHLFALLLILNK